MGRTTERSKQIERFMKKTMFWNIVLSALKLTTGIIGSSFALISDAINSISDIFSSLVGIIGIKISGKKADKEHPYGHEKFEGVFALVLAAVILFTAIELIRTNVVTLIEYFKNGTALRQPNYIAIVGIAIALIIKFYIYFSTRKMAIKHKSSILKADALNHFGDIFSTFGGLLAIIGSMLGAPYLDQIGSVLIAGFIIRVAISIALSSINQLVDEAADDETAQKIKEAILLYVHESNIDVLKTRHHGVRFYVDLEVSLRGDMSLDEAHDIAEAISSAIKNAVPDVKRTMVHVNPIIGEKVHDEIP